MLGLASPGRINEDTKLRKQKSGSTFEQPPPVPKKKKKIIIDKKKKLHNIRLEESKDDLNKTKANNPQGWPESQFSQCEDTNQSVKMRNENL